MRAICAAAMSLCVLLAGCDFDGRSRPITNNAKVGIAYDKHCIEGVTYLRWDRSITVQLDRDGKVIPCQ